MNWDSLVCGEGQCNWRVIQLLQLDVAEKDLVLGPSKGALRDVYFPGFPTMKHLKYTVRREWPKRTFENVKFPGFPEIRPHQSVRSAEP